MEMLSAPTRPPIPQTSDHSSGTAELLTKQVKLVEFRSGEAVIRHPELRGFLRDGWDVESAVPHIDGDEVKLLVVMRRHARFTGIVERR